MSLIYDGHDFGELLYFGEPQFSWLQSRPETQDVAGRNGSVFLGMTYGPSNVSFSVGMVGNLEDRRNTISVLGDWLMVDEPKPLYLPDTPDRYYLAVPDGALELERMYDGDMGTMAFSIVDPIAYGVERTVTVPSGGAVEFVVGGTAPTMPTIAAASAVRNATSLVWGLRLDSADYVHVETGSASARRVDIDCGERVCKVANAAKLPTLDSDWLVLSPGSHTIAMDNGTGAATLTWRERWY